MTRVACPACASTDAGVGSGSAKQPPVQRVGAGVGGLGEHVSRMARRASAPVKVPDSESLAIFNAYSVNT